MEFQFKTESLVSMALGVLALVLMFWFNKHLFKRGAAPGKAGLEWLYYIIAFVTLPVCWIENIRYMQFYGEAAGWWHWTEMVFSNPASSSAGLDLYVSNLVLLPLWSITDGRRLGMKQPWIYFAASIVTSFAFAVAIFLAFRERQLRYNAQSGPA